MDVVQLSAWAKPGKPIPMGNAATILLGDTNAAGETHVTLTFDSRRMKKLMRRDRDKFDRRGGTAQNSD